MITCNELVQWYDTRMVGMTEKQNGTSRTKAKNTTKNNHKILLFKVPNFHGDTLNAIHSSLNLKMPSGIAQWQSTSRMGSNATIILFGLAYSHPTFVTPFSIVISYYTLLWN